MVSIPTWENEYRKPFLVNGVSILEVLSETIDASNAGKENRKVNFAKVTLLTTH
jgi:Ase1/PRC1/MAP65 family protein